MTICPDCGFDNIPGEDVCEQCQQPLTVAELQSPTSPLARQLLKDRINDLAPKAAITVAPSTAIGDVLRLMVSEKNGCVVVVEDDEVVGIFSDRDALMRVNCQAAQMADRPISELMTQSPETLEGRDKIAFALHRMDLGGYRHIPILTKGKVTNVVSIRDILRYMAQHIDDEVEV